MRHNPSIDGQLSPVQASLVPRIADLISSGGFGAGDRLNEVALSRTLRVSRTPIRAVLRHLVSLGVTRRLAGGGFAVVDQSPAQAARTAAAVAAGQQQGEVDRLFLAIAKDRRRGHLSTQISETSLMRRYRVGRALLQRVLALLADAAVVERLPGRGWAFLPTFEDAVARRESYNWRMLIEPGALLEPDYRLQPTWIADMRKRHEHALRAAWRETSSIAFYEMNAAFHEGLAAGAGNRFLLIALQQQNRLRRISNYDWMFGHERVLVNTREHLEILDRIEANELTLAAALLRQHLIRARDLRRPDGDLLQDNEVD
jgi:DNA-binding GntR family transcriptional regulator